MAFPVGRSPLTFSGQVTCGPDDDNSEIPFCSKDNVAECLSYLNQVLIVLFALLISQLRSSVDVVMSKLLKVGSMLLFPLQLGRLFCIVSTD